MTTIEWTDETWNPLRARRLDGTGKVGWACVRVSQGCVNCYAATQNKTAFWGGTGLDYTVPDLTKVETFVDEKAIEKPLHWRAPRRIFVCSMTDLFGEWVRDDEIERVWGIMARSPQHTFQVLTKRPERMREWLEQWAEDGALKPLPNVWLGTSVEDQKAADERIPYLLDTPAAVRFLSCEPLLGPITLPFKECCPEHRVLQRTGLHWAIVGGESGHRARPMDLAWARSLVLQCRAAGVAPFVKQLGSHAHQLEFENLDVLVCYGRNALSMCGASFRDASIRESHGRDMAEWPEDLRVREFPDAVPA